MSQLVSIISSRPQAGMTYEPVTQTLCVLAYTSSCTDFCDAANPYYCTSLTLNLPTCNPTSYGGSLLEDLWYLTKIQAPDAWSISTGSKNIIVAVIDSGVDYNHPDLAANMWVNSDGSHGYNFVDNNNDPMDDSGGGTNAAGIIGAVGNNDPGAVGNNGTATVGVNWNVSIMALKANPLDDSGGRLSWVALTFPHFTEHLELEFPDYSLPLSDTVLQIHPV